MATIEGTINYMPEESMNTAIGILIGLFKAKIDGGANTNSVAGPKLKPVTPLNEAIEKVMNIMKGHDEFEGLRQKEGHFIRKFREIDEAFANWDTLEEKPSKNSLYDLHDNYMRDKGKMLVYTGF